MSEYLRQLRSKIGHDLVLVPMVNALVIDEQQRVLLVRHAADELWGTPSGMPAPFETPADAVVRSTWEETALLVTPVRIVGIFGGMECSVTYRDGDQMSFIATAFEVRVQSGTLRPSSDLFMTRQATASEARDMACYPHVSEMLQAAFAGSEAWFKPASWRAPAKAAN